ncbi:DUF317 domain-containing protein [Streptomyces noursei]|uniref:DUF317 domain-containing protein n=1 Tax=Streptomyces noursei TaxID=1971 RepID=UPI0036315AF4
MSHERFYSRVNGPTLHRINQVRYLDEVTPRHLAGGGDPRHVTEYLLAAGWTSHAVPGYPHVLLESPDQQLHLTLEPSAPDEHDAWWRVHPASRTGWSAQFSGHTPVEIIAGFTDALTTPSPGTSADPVGLWRIAEGNGWPQRLAGTDQAALSPDETAILSRVRTQTFANIHDATGTPTWRWTAQIALPLTEDRLKRLWWSSIDETAPAPALAGFVTTLTDPAPLLRDEGQTPNHTFGYLNTTRSPLSPEQHRQHHQQRLDTATRAAPPTRTATRPSPPQPKPPRRPR